MLNKNNGKCPLAEGLTVITVNPCEAKAGQGARPLRGGGGSATKV